MCKRIRLLQSEERFNNPTKYIYKNKYKTGE
jgi:hypothetical protein